MRPNSESLLPGLRPGVPTLAPERGARAAAVQDRLPAWVRGRLHTAADLLAADRAAPGCFHRFGPSGGAPPKSVRSRALRPRL